MPGVCCVVVQDLDIGVELQVYGRTFLLVDANNSTRKFWQEAHGKTLGE